MSSCLQLGKHHATVMRWVDIVHDYSSDTIYSDTIYQNTKPSPKPTAKSSKAVAKASKPKPTTAAKKTSSTKSVKKTVSRHRFLSSHLSETPLI